MIYSVPHSFRTPQSYRLAFFHWNMSEPRIAEFFSVCITYASKRTTMENLFAHAHAQLLSCHYYDVSLLEILQGPHQNCCKSKKSNNTLWKWQLENCVCARVCYFIVCVFASMLLVADAVAIATAVYVDDP